MPLFLFMLGLSCGVAVECRDSLNACLLVLCANEVLPHNTAICCRLSTMTSAGVHNHSRTLQFEVVAMHSGSKTSLKVAHKARRAMFGACEFLSNLRGPYGDRLFWTPKQTNVWASPKGTQTIFPKRDPPRWVPSTRREAKH